MPKGKPWTREEEKQLRALVGARLAVNVIAGKLRKSPDAIVKKCKRIGLEVVDTSCRISPTTSRLSSPKELPSIEETLQMLAGALKAACKPGLDRVEVQRLQAVATLARTYKDGLAEYINYRAIEEHLLDLDRKYEQLAKKT